MSAPQTNISKQEKRHRTPLYGMLVLVGLVALGYFIYVAFLAAEGNEPGEEEAVVPAVEAVTD